MGASEILLILTVYLLLFGAKGVPALAQTLGKAVYQFRNATKDVQDEIMKSANDIRKQAELRPDQMEIPSRPPVTESVKIVPPTESVPSSTSPGQSQNTQQPDPPSA